MEILHGRGIKAIIAPTGKDGMDMIKSFRPHGILLDLVLPDTDGFTVLRDLKSTKELKNIPVMIISGKKKGKEYIGSGAYDYIEKPVNIDQFESSLQKMISIAETAKTATRKWKKILLVEDNAVLRRSILGLLAGENTMIIEAESQNEALEKINNNEFQLTIIDLNLKKGNGLDICKYIKEKRLNIPILIYTGKDLSDAQEKTLKKYSESIILKTVHSDVRLLEEANYFLYKTKENIPRRDSKGIKTGNPLRHLDLKDKTILIADDDIKNVFVLTSALEDFNANIIDAQNGKEAIKLLETRKVDLILMDIMMPEMDGYETIREIRKNEKLKNIPVIAITAKAIAWDREKCLEAGADDYISKPIDYDVLISLIGAWIDKKRV